MKTAFALLFFLAPTTATAESSLLIHAASWHFGVTGYNQTNPGLGFRYTVGDWHFSIGGYKNSLSNTSAYAGVGHTVFKTGPLALNIHGGVVSGYLDSTAPFILPELVVSLGRVGLMFNYAPRLKVGQFGVDQALGLTLKVPF